MTAFMGTQFIWWVGIVENRNDPLKIGRVQCRAFAWDTASKAMLPTDQLAWSHPILPINNDKVQPPKEGVMVFGFYMDGADRQMPMIMGQIPGIPDTSTDPSHGFTDPRNSQQLQSSPRPPQMVMYKTEGQGVQIQEAPNANRYPNTLNEPTSSRLTRNENIQDTIVQQKIDSVVMDVDIATGDPDDDNPPMWSEPKTPYNAVYPYNQVNQTESGHVFELDDTPGAERIQIFHRSGTFQEMHPDGSMVSKVTMSSYNITMADHNLNVMGDHNTAINQDQTNNVTGDYAENIGGDKNVVVVGDYTIIVQGTLNIKTTGDTNLTVGGDYNIKVTGDYNLEAASVNEDISGEETINASLVTSSSDIIAGGISVEHHVHGGVLGGRDTTGSPEG